MDQLSVTPQEEIWGYKWLCDCGFFSIKTLPVIANTECPKCKKPMKHVIRP